jgi:cellulase
MVGLHNSQQVDGAEIFMGCAQLKVTGPGSGTCGPTIEIPGAYDPKDPSIYIPNYYDGFKTSGISSYKAPGGAVASCNGSNSGSAPTAPNSTVAGTPSSVASSSALVETAPKPASTESVGGGGGEAPTSSPVAPSVPAPAPAPAPGAGDDGSADALPATFTLKTFVSWLQSKATSKMRRHARAF